MYLTQYEQDMLDGKMGVTTQKSMAILVKLGEIYGAERMIPVNNVHSPGVSYRVAGDAGLNYVTDASKDTHFCVAATLNTIGIDRKAWEKVGFPKDFSEKQLELCEAYERMGAIPINSCAPYLNGSLPVMGEHVAWGESSAIAYANSVLGARTNREGGPTALAAAICGRVPEYGLHLNKNRKAKRHIQVAIPLKTDKDYAALGYFIGSSVGQDVPVITGIDSQPSMENLKTMCAAVASSGAVALFHIVGVTPEAPTFDAVVEKDAHLPCLTFGKAEYKKICDKFNYSGKIDFVVIGCPHASINEINSAAQLLKGKKLKAGLWLCTSRQIKALADEMGIVKTIEDAGGELICDTCPVLCPTLWERKYRSIATNSAKMAHYAPGLWNLQPVLLTQEQCIQAAIAGKWEEI